MSADGGPAFPAMHFDLTDNEHGLSMRDYFAAKAMHGIVSASPWKDYGLDWKESVAQAAYAMADAMLKARQS